MIFRIAFAPRTKIPVNTPRRALFALLAACNKKCDFTEKKLGGLRAKMYLRDLGNPKNFPAAERQNIFARLFRATFRSLHVILSVAAQSADYICATWESGKFSVPLFKL
jgi:hypothetical protein